MYHRLASYRMDATLPVDLRRFRPVVETIYRKIQDSAYLMEPMGESPFVAITTTTTTASKMSPPLASTDENGTTVTSSVTATAAAVVARIEPPQPQQPAGQPAGHRSLKFSVENILDPNKFTGHANLPAQPRLNNNIFQPHLHHQATHHPLFHHPHHPWLLPVNPANLLHHHHHHHQQQQHIHHVDVHSTSVESEDSLYDRSSDLESG